MQKLARVQSWDTWAAKEKSNLNEHIHVDLSFPNFVIVNLGFYLNALVYLQILSGNNSYLNTCHNFPFLWGSSAMFLQQCPGVQSSRCPKLKRTFFSLVAQASLQCSNTGFKEDELFSGLCRQGGSEKHKWTQSIELLHDWPPAKSEPWFPLLLLHPISRSLHLCIPGIWSSTSVKDQCFLT